MHLAVKYQCLWPEMERNPIGLVLVMTMHECTLELDMHDDRSSKDAMPLHDLTAGSSSIHLEPAPRLLDVFLPSLRESDQFCTFELDGCQCGLSLLRLSSKSSRTTR